MTDLEIANLSKQNNRIIKTAVLSRVELWSR